MSKVCIITGGTSGIGLATARAMHDAGYRVYELSRREAGTDCAVHIQADVTKEDTLRAAVDFVLAQEDHIDVVINNAGFGISGAVEFTDTADAIRQLDVNFFGMVRMNHVVLPILRKQGYGRIVNLSSVAGSIPIPFQTYYSASKAAINSYTMATANEVRPFGGQVCCVQPGDIRTTDDLRRLPVTTKTDLQLHPGEFVCVPRNRIIDYVTTSGTLGDPVTFALTEEDLDRLAYNEAESFTTAGCTPEDILQLMTTIDRRFMAGLAYFMGARELGCGVIRVGNGIPELQWDTIRRIGPTGCIVVPSFLTKLVAYAEEHGIDYRRSSLRRAICIGEALRDTAFGNNTLGAKITELWPELELFSTYASTEMQTSITECGHHCGGHVPADMLLVELLDEQNNPVAEGEEGEVVITTLGVRGMPLLRFKTGDICIARTGRCACGRTTMRLSSVIGRRGQMIKFKGTTLYPPALYDILENIPGVSNYIIEVFTGSLGTDQIVLRIGSARRDEAFEKEIKDTFRSKVRVAPEVVFEPVEYIAKKQMPQMSRKQIKFVDLREQTK